jgi:cell division protein FtsL
MRPFFFHMGPAALCITCVLLVGLMAVLYISQVGQVVAANHQLQQIRSEQAALERQNQDLIDMLAQQQSPGYIAEQAQKKGLRPADPKNLWILKVSHLQEIGKANQPIQP